MRFLRFWGFHLDLNKHIEKKSNKKMHADTCDTWKINISVNSWRFVDKRRIREYMIIDFELCLSSKEIKMECEDNFVSVVCKGQALTGCIWKSSFLFRYRSAKRVFSAQTLTNFPRLRWPWFAFLFISFFRFFFCRKNNY